MLKRFLAAKKTKSSQNRFQKMAVFQKLKGIHINCGYRDPQNAHPLPKRRLLTYFS